jgi:hypothetical protein
MMAALSMAGLLFIFWSHFSARTPCGNILDQAWRKNAPGARHLVQDLGQAGFHPGTLPGSEDNGGGRHGGFGRVPGGKEEVTICFYILL